MKAKIVLLFFFLSGLFRAQQNTFIIGADWLNSNRWDRVVYNTPMSESYWNLINDLNLNYGTLAYNTYWSYSVQRIKDELVKANNHGIKIELNTYDWPGLHYGERRWMYQIEGTLDFTVHQTGEDFNETNNPAEPHWSLAKVDNNAPNCRRLRTESGHQAGIVSSGLTATTQIPNGSNYYVKIKLRKMQLINDDTPIIRVTMTNQNTMVFREAIIYANSLSYNSWAEAELFSYFKSSTGPESPRLPDTLKNTICTDSLGMCGIQDYSVTTNDYTPYDIEIYWYGLVNCELDYVTIEDNASHELHNGTYYNNILTGINTFYPGYPALSQYKLWDEPNEENFLPIRYANNIVKTIFSNGGLAFNNGKNSQRYLAQTQLDIQRSDIYVLYNENSVYTPVPPPGGDNYLPVFQNSMQIMNSYLEEEITHSVIFGGNFWFTPQAGAWYSWLRQPSAYEIKLMANLGIAYGAKGIQYFMFSIPYDQNDQVYPYTQLGTGFLADDDHNNPVPRYLDSYGDSLWQITKNSNIKIASQGNMLMSLKWISSHYLHNSTLPSGKYITNVQSYYCALCQSIYDLEVDPYIQFSFFESTPQDYNKEHFYVINRRTMPEEYRTISITFDKTQTNPLNLKNWTIREVGTNNYWSSKDSGSFRTTYQPAEGKLFTLEPTVLNGGDLIYSETISGNNTLSGPLSIKQGDTLTIAANSTYNINNNISIESGGTLILNPGATLNITNGASLVVNGNLVIKNNAVLNIPNGDSITVYGHMICETNLTIPSGRALVLHQGAILNLQNGITLTVNGTLTADGFPNSITVNSTTDDGSLIIFSGASSSSSSLNNVVFNDAEGIRCLNSANITIRNCTFNFLVEGIYVYNSSPQIIHNTIYDPILDAIWCQSSVAYSNYNYMTVFGNTIVKSTYNDMYQNYSGIWIYNSSLPNIGQNILHGFCYGILIQGGSTVECQDTLCNAPYPNNLITGNINGIYVANSSTLYAGSIYDMMGMNNSIHNNTNYDIQCFDHSYIEAGYNWWGGGSANYRMDGTSDIEFYDDINFDPWAGQNMVAILPSNQPATSKHLSKSMGSDSSSNYNLSAGLLLEKQGRIDDAINFYKGLISNDQHVRLALSNLVRMKYKYDKNEITDYFGSLLMGNQKYYPAIKKLMGDIYLHNNQFDNAITAYDNVIRNDSAGYDGISARFEKLFAYLHIQNNNTMALQLLTEIKSLNVADDETKMRISAAEGLLGLSKHNKLPRNADNSKVNTLIPKTYGLCQNYPNPFNPSTTIRYQIPKPGVVTLKVYDILGREVTTLVIEYKIEGSYDFTFDASKFASGVYIYQFRVNDYVSSKKMILLK